MRTDCHASPAVGAFGSLAVIADDDGGTALRWRWAAPRTSPLIDFGTPDLPAENDYRLCVYDHRGLPFGVRRRRSVVAALRVPSGGSCGRAACWRRRPARFRYHDAAGTSDGVTQVLAQNVQFIPTPHLAYLLLNQREIPQDTARVVVCFLG